MGEGVDWFPFDFGIDVDTDIMGESLIDEENELKIFPVR